MSRGDTESVLRKARLSSEPVHIPQSRYRFCMGRPRKNQGPGFKVAPKNKKLINSDPQFGKLSPRSRKRTIRSGRSIAKRLVNDILDIERLESGRFEFKMEDCGAADLLKRAIADSERIALRVLPTSARVRADSDAVLQTLTNLVGNAIKFSPPHTAATLSARTEGDEVRFLVRDRGRGIPAEKLDAIFGRFLQVDASDSRQKGGTGLGWAICQSIVEQHGVKVWVESELGKGC